MANRLINITESMLLEIKKKSVLYLDDSPKISPTALKQAFAGIVTDSTKSIISELKRVINDLNGIFSKLFVGVYDVLPNVTTFQEEDKIILLDGSIWVLSSGVWVQTSMSQLEYETLYSKVYEDLEERITTLENGSIVYVSNEEPIDAQEGTLWIDTSSES